MQKNLFNLQVLVEAIAKVWDNPRYVTMSVIIQNMAAYAGEKDESFFVPYLKVLKLNAEYAPNCHVSQWIYSEAWMIVEGHFISESEPGEPTDYEYLHRD